MVVHPTFELRIITKVGPTIEPLSRAALIPLVVPQTRRLFSLYRQKYFQCAYVLTNMHLGNLLGVTHSKMFTRQARLTLEFLSYDLSKEDASCF